jgi:hypothetical protein
MMRVVVMLIAVLAVFVAVLAHAGLISAKPTLLEIEFERFVDLMAEGCGPGWHWSNRRVTGGRPRVDWPHGRCRPAGVCGNRNGYREYSSQGRSECAHSDLLWRNGLSRPSDNGPSARFRPARRREYGNVPRSSNEPSSSPFDAEPSPRNPHRHQ